MSFGSILTTAGLIAIGVLLFELIILFHEGGHFIAAKLSKVKVNEFSLGMGPKLFSFTKGETTYSLRLLPIGGFCAMEGEDEDSENPRAFNNAKTFKRMIIIVAGAVMNILLGLILMFVTLLPSEGFMTNNITQFPTCSYSSVSGIEEGDKIVSVNGYKINNSMDLSYALAKLKVQYVDGDSLQIYKQDCIYEVFKLMKDTDNLSKLNTEDLNAVYHILYNSIDEIQIAKTKTAAEDIFIDTFAQVNSYYDTEVLMVPAIAVQETRPRYRADLVVERNGDKITLNDVDFYTDESTSEPQMHLDFYVEGKDKTFFTLLGETGSQTVSMVRMVGDSLVGLVKGEFGFNDVSGPIGAASATVEVAQQGLEKSFGDAVLNIVFVMTVITVNLGIVNMLPFPALDGGRFVFLLIEAIFRKPIPRKVEAIVNAFGLALLLLFILVISFKDVWMLIL